MTEHVLRVTYGVPGHQHRVRYLVKNGLTQTIQLHGEPVGELMVNVQHQRTDHTPGALLRDARSKLRPVFERWLFQSDPEMKPNIWPRSYVPSARPLWTILADVVAHGEQCPTHGMNCACVDPLIREIRQHLNRVIPEVERIYLADDEESWGPDNWTYDPVQAEAARKARWRITHVMNAVMRSIS